MKAGDLVIVTAGEYSDYGITETARVLIDFNWDECLKRWLAVHPEQAKIDRGCGDFRHMDFLQSLFNAGLLEHQHIAEVRLGDYGVPPTNLEPVMPTNCAAYHRGPK